jgi:MFS transporter, FSR family, fosmidomycin resistance protein
MSSLTRSLPRPSTSNIALTLVSAAHALNHAYVVLMPLAYLYVTKEIPLTNTDIGVMTSVGSSVSGVLQIAFSFLSLYIARRVLLGAGQVIMGLSSLLTGAAPNFPIFFLGNFLTRVGSSPQHPVGNSILSDHYDQKSRGFALSMHVAGGNVGTVAVPLVGTLLLTVIGWRTTLFLYGALVMLMGVALVVFVNDAKNAELNGGGAPVTLRDSPREIWRILRDRNMALILAATTVAAGGRGLGVLITFLPLYLASLHINETVVALLVTLMLTGSVIGPITLGKVSDVRGRRGILLVVYAAATLLTFALIASGANIAPLLPVLFLLGIASYSESPILQTFLADASAGYDRDLAFGVYFTIAFGVGSFWAAVLGALIDHFGYTTGFYLMAASYVGAALLILPTRDIRRA